MPGISDLMPSGCCSMPGTVSGSTTIFLAATAVLYPTACWSREHSFNSALCSTSAIYPASTHFLIHNKVYQFSESELLAELSFKDEWKNQGTPAVHRFAVRVATISFGARNPIGAVRVGTAQPKTKRFVAGAGVQKRLEVPAIVGIADTRERRLQFLLLIRASGGIYVLELRLARVDAFDVAANDC